MLLKEKNIAIEILSSSQGGFTHDTLARALASSGTCPCSEHLLEDCLHFCQELESSGRIVRRLMSTASRESYFVFVR